jgi:hypothetical protein
MRSRGWLALAAYALAVAAGVALAVRRGNGPAVSALAPLDGYAAPPSPPAWAFIRVGPSGPTPPAGSGLRVPAVVRAVVQIVAGYAASPDGVVAAAFPGLRVEGAAPGSVQAGAAAE